MADRSGYIGRAPGDSSVTVARQTFSPTGITTDFTFESGYTPGYFDIFINGAKMIEGSDYTSTDGSTFVILNGGVISGDVIEGVAYKAFNAATATIGISSAGTPISTQANTLNFVGTGNTFALRGTTIDVSISAGAGGTWSNYDTNTGVTTSKKVKISNNLEVTGVTTSTGGFVGALTGNASGTAGGLSGTPDITVRNITGVAATFTGVLTYEDVTNIDSVGIITAQSDVVIADKIIHLSDTNTAIRFPAADTFTVETGGSERVRVDSSGRLLVGAFSALTGSDSQYSFVQNIGNSFGSTTPAYMSLGRSEVVTSMSNNDPVGRIFFTDNAAATFAYIEAAVDNTPGTNDYPGRLTFLTTPDGSATPTERLRITSAGSIGVGEADPSPHGGEYRGIDVGYKGSGITGRTGNPTFTMRSNIYYDGSNWKYGEGSTTAGVLSIGGAQLIFENAASGTAGATATLTERLRITSDGQVQATGPGSSGSVISSKVTTNNGGYLAYEGIASNDTTTFSVNHNGDIVSAGTVSDSIGDLRMLGNNTQSAGSTYTLVLSDSGKTINKVNGGGVTVPQGVFTTGHMVTVINASGSAFTITQGSSFTLYNTSDGTTGNRTLGGRGIATIFFIDTNNGYISGAGLS